MIFLGYILTIIYVFIILIISSVLKIKKAISAEQCRKIVHIFVSLAWIIMYLTLKDSIHILIIPLFFIIFNYISYKYKVIPGMEIGNRKSLGTIYYPVSMLIMATFSYINNQFLPIYGMSLFTMAFADGLAPIIAEKIPTGKIFNTSKTFSGSITVFVVSLLIIIIFTTFFKLELSLIRIIFISLLNTIIELYSKKGLDNLTLPLGMFLITYILLQL